MTTDVLAIRAHDLGRVDTPVSGWRSLAFDLRALRGEVVSGCVWVSAARAGGDELRLGDAGAHATLLAISVPRPRNGARRVRVPLSDSALGALTRAAGEFLTVDAWVKSDGEMRPLDDSEIFLELKAVSRPSHQQAA